MQELDSVRGLGQKSPVPVCVQERDTDTQQRDSGERRETCKGVERPDSALFPFQNRLDWRNHEKEDSSRPLL